MPYAEDFPSTTPLPTEAGWRWPAEWEPTRAVWTSFPNLTRTWGSALAKAQLEFASFLLALSNVIEVNVCVTDEEHLQTAISCIKKKATAPSKGDKATGNMANLHFHFFPSTEAWIRDFGPIWLKHRNGAHLALDHQFNTWGGKYPPFELENQIPRLIAEYRNHARHALDFILEGGSIDTNGAGTVLTSEACLLTPTRNPQFTKSQIEDHLKRTFHLQQVVWLGDGIAGDDTDGHIDDMTRFIAEDVILTAVEEDPSDINHAALQENFERLQQLRLPDGRKPTIIPIPMPRAVEYEGERLPASHLNFLFAGGCVFVPDFPHHNRPDAHQRFEEAMARHRPGTKVIWLDTTHIVVGRGSLHCLSMQEPL
ncbi:MAG: agmatine deiminase family protein [Candidatus Sumerlaeia bacterium]|nr:agmatine deiminase family protein [Candidatus Sumerlaeia bacterium]